VSEPRDDAELAERFRQLAAASRSRAPLYGTLAEHAASEPALYRLLLLAPATQRLPVLLFAAVHSLLIGGARHELRSWYPNLTPDPRPHDDPGLPAVFRSFVDEHREPLGRLLATRTTQTNEVGRCAVILVALGLVDAEMGPIGHLDVGASGGLNLLTDHYEYHYRSGADHSDRQVGGPSTVVLEAATTGPVPVPASLPRIVTRCGLDQSPVDVSDDDEAHWLEACVWPDQTDRFERLRAAISLARASPPEILAGDAVTGLAPALEHLGRDAHPVVTNTWVLNYLTAQERRDYLAELERIGAGRDLSWIYVEAPSLIPELPTEPDPRDPVLSVLTLVRWRGGQRSVEHLATCHPHGFWIDWRTPPA
jgi:hypothetical protein